MSFVISSGSRDLDWQIELARSSAVNKHRVVDGRSLHSYTIIVGVVGSKCAKSIKSSKASQQKAFGFWEFVSVYSNQRQVRI